MTHHIKVTEHGLSQTLLKTVEVGDSVSWDGTVVFGVQSDDSRQLDDSDWGSDGLVSGQGAYIHQFKEAGIYHFVVKVHGLLVAFYGTLMVG